MMQRWGWKLAVLCLTVSAVLLLGNTGARAQTHAAGQAKADRLIMGLILPYRDYIRPWVLGTSDHNIQHDPAFEWLFEVDVESGKYNPWLAESAEMAKDGRSWHIKLRKGVQFHHGWGEFTAADVVHNHALWCDDNYPGRKDPPTSGYREGICAVERIEVINDHELTMRCKVACLDVPFYYSSASNVMIFSKQQWDAEGEAGYERKPAGTGPYMFKELVPNQRMVTTKNPNWWGGPVNGPDEVVYRIMREQ